MIWPVPESYAKEMPRRGERGGFWEDRGDRRHGGVDLYAPPASPILACVGGQVVQVAMFTSPAIVSYWRETWFVLVEQEDGLYVRYAEMEEILVQVGDSICAGDQIGCVGQVLDREKIDASSPPYIRRLKEHSLLSMLHLEIFDDFPQPSPDYLGGNWFRRRYVPNLLDPQKVFCRLA